MCCSLLRHQCGPSPSCGTSLVHQIMVSKIFQMWLICRDEISPARRAMSGQWIVGAWGQPESHDEAQGADCVSAQDIVGFWCWPQVKKIEMKQSSLLIFFLNLCMCSDYCYIVFCSFCKQKTRLEFQYKSEVFLWHNLEGKVLENTVVQWRNRSTRKPNKWGDTTRVRNGKCLFTITNFMNSEVN